MKAEAQRIYARLDDPNISEEEMDRLLARLEEIVPIRTKK